MAVVSLNYEMIKMDQVHFTKNDMIQSMEFIQLKDYMNIDLESMVSLGILSHYKHKSSTKKAIVKLFDKCASKIGNTLLTKILKRPLFDLHTIKKRLCTVESIIIEFEGGWKQSLIRQISDCIRGTSDIIKTIHELRIGNLDAKVWKQLRNFLINVDRMKHLVETSEYLVKCEVFKNFSESFSFDNIQSIRSTLETVLDFDTDINTLSIQNNYDQVLKGYKDNYDEMENILSDIALNLKNQTGLDTVTAYIPQFGYLIAIEKGEHNEPGFELIFTTSTTYYYKNDIMTEMDTKFGDLYSLIRDKEIEILQQLKDKIIYKLTRFISVYELIGHIDVLICFAIVSINNGFSKPELLSSNETNTKIVDIVGSFHPLIEKSDFITNDIKIIDSKVIVITGPNYSGKSTILTQVGITIYLAQIGCYVPAASGKFSIFKNILTRINTLESISCTQSTFLKDCQQMSKCIYKSNRNSLILIDEFGKGTDVNDGPGLLVGILKHYLDKEDECPVVLVSTHMADVFNNNMIDMKNPLLEFKQMKIMTDIENSFKLTFLYELTSGLANNSRGLYCAKQSGIDSKIIETAQYIITMIEKGENIVNEFSELDEKEMMVIRNHRERIKKFLELNFQDWEVHDVNRLKKELFKILQE
jgi:DNA mismatch repair protein MSH5